ncbi:MAG TPA: glycosyltransferase family 39 protein [Gaiellaceae bacterium]|nr:glycosyltransferase family 39 protein [Gaiellaceae bacterium]
MRERVRRHGAVLLVIGILVLVAVAVRAPDAVGESFWADEVASGHVITAPNARWAASRIRRESSPPVWFFVARATHQTGGKLAELSSAFRPLSSFGAVRLLSVLFSAATVALVVLYARRLLPLWAAALAGLLVALGFQFVLHGKELRPYALLTLFAVAFPLVFEWVVHRPAGRRLAALAAFVAAGSMTHYFFLLPLFTGLIWLWLAPHGRSVRLRTTAAVAVGLVPLLVWLPVVLYQAGRVNEYFPPFGILRTLNVYSTFFASPAVWQGEGPGFPARLGLLVAILAGAAVLARRAEGRLCALLAVVPWVVTALVWLAGLRIFDTRNLLVVAPFAAVCLAALVAAIPVRPLAWAAGATLAAVAVWTYTIDRDLGRTPYDEIAAELVDLGWTPESPLVVHARYPQTRPLTWHLPGHPYVRVSQPGPGACEQAFVVAEGADGRAWLSSHQDSVEDLREFPWYGSQLAAARRTPDVAVARLASSPELLEDGLAQGAFLLQARGRRQAPCLEAKNTPP